MPRNNNKVSDLDERFTFLHKWNDLYSAALNSDLSDVSLKLAHQILVMEEKPENNDFCLVQKHVINKIAMRIATSTMTKIFITLEEKTLHLCLRPPASPNNPVRAVFFPNEECAKNSETCQWRFWRNEDKTTYTITSAAGKFCLAAFKELLRFDGYEDSSRLVNVAEASEDGTSPEAASNWLIIPRPGDNFELLNWQFENCYIHYYEGNGFDKNYGICGYKQGIYLRLEE